MIVVVTSVLYIIMNIILRLFLVDFMFLRRKKCKKPSIWNKVIFMFCAFLTKFLVDIRQR